MALDINADHTDMIGSSSECWIFGEDTFWLDQLTGTWHDNWRGTLGQTGAAAGQKSLGGGHHLTSTLVGLSATRFCAEANKI